MWLNAVSSPSNKTAILKEKSVQNEFIPTCTSSSSEEWRKKQQSALFKRAATSLNDQEVHQDTRNVQSTRVDYWTFTASQYVTFEDCRSRDKPVKYFHPIRGNATGLV